MCGVCGRADVRKMPRCGKRTYRHLCPHGVPCVSGDRLLGIHANNPPIAGKYRCDECWKRHKAVA